MNLAHVRYPPAPVLHKNRVCLAPHFTEHYRKTSLTQFPQFHRTSQNSRQFHAKAAVQAAIPSSRFVAKVNLIDFRVASIDMRDSELLRQHVKEQHN
jgi:hypothetical protein